jgi:hypothetical protein
MPNIFLASLAINFPLLKYFFNFTRMLTENLRDSNRSTRTWLFADSSFLVGQIGSRILGQLVHLQRVREDRKRSIGRQNMPEESAILNAAMNC